MMYKDVQKLKYIRAIINFTKIKKLILQIPTTTFLIKPNIINIKY